MGQPAALVGVLVVEGPASRRQRRARAVADERDDDVIALPCADLPPVDVDPVFVDAVEDALSGPPLATSKFVPDRAMGPDPHDFAGLYIRHRSSFAAHARRFLRDPLDV